MNNGGQLTHRSGEARLEITDKERKMSTDDIIAQRKRALDRIKKCLALSKSNEPNEAAAAIRQAQKLMMAHGIDEEELLGFEITNELVITPEPPKKKFPMYLMGITSLMMRAFGVQGMFEIVLSGTDKLGYPVYRQGVRYFGKGGAAVMAKYTHEVIFTNMQKAWREHLKTYIKNDTQVGDRASFWIGWLSGVENKVIEFAMTPEEKELLKRKMTEYAGGELSSAKMNNQELSHEALRAGAAASKDFALHRPMEGSKQKMLGN
jgi:hypothetical protein